MRVHAHVYIHISAALAKAFLEGYIRELAAHGEELGDWKFEA